MALPALAIGGQLLGHAFQNYQSRKANQRYKNFMKKRESELEGMFNQEYYKNALETPGAQSALAIVRDRMKENNQNLNNQAVRTGSTAESSAASKSVNNQQMSDLVNRLISKEGRYKSTILKDYIKNKALINQEKTDYMKTKMNDWAAFGQNVAGSATSVLDSYTKGLYSSNPNGAILK